MSNRFNVILISLVLVFCLIMEETAATNAPQNRSRVLFSFGYSANRKLLQSSTVRAFENFEPLVPGREQKDGEETVARGLRTVPSGPNPLHHNGSPTKPQTP